MNVYYLISKFPVIVRKIHDNRILSKRLSPRPHIVYRQCVYTCLRKLVENVEKFDRANVCRKTRAPGRETVADS